MATTPRGALHWLGDRLGVALLLDGETERRVVRERLELHIVAAVIWLLTLEIASGILLLMHYRPSGNEAFESVVAINGAIPFGALVRGIHAWSTHLLVAALLGYVFLLLYRRAYTSPREVAWMTAVLLLATTFAFALTGSVLTWNADAHVHAAIAGRLSERLPLVGHWLERFVLGGSGVGGRTLERAFGFHAAVLPAMVTVFAILHVRARQRAGAKEPDEGDRGILLRDLVLTVATEWAAIFFLVLALATFVPPATGAPLDLKQPTEGGLHPAWYFLALHRLLAITPGELLGVDGVAVVGTFIMAGWGVLTIIPFLDRHGAKWIRYFAVVSLVVGALLTLFAAYAPR